MATGSLKPVYVLFGGDAFLLDAARSEIVAAAIGDSDPQVAVTTFESDADLAVVLDELRTAPFLAPRRAVILRDADVFLSRKEDDKNSRREITFREVLEKYLENPSENSTLILLAASWPKNTRLYKLIDKVGQAIDCSAPDARGLPSHIAAAAARRGKKIQPEASQLLAAWVGADLGSLDGEVEKLSLYAADRPMITSEDVAKLVTASGGTEPFAITNAITAGDPAAALNCLAHMLTKRGEEFKVSGLIAWHLRRVLAAQQAIAAGKPAKSALPNMPFHQQNAFLAMLQRRPLPKLQADFRRLIATDLAMKSGTNASAALQELVVQLCV